MKKDLIYLLIIGLIVLSGCSRVPPPIHPADIADSNAWGEIFLYKPDKIPHNFQLTTDDTFYNISELKPGSLFNFTYVNETQANGGTYLTAQKNGTFKSSFDISYTSIQNSGSYSFVIVKNHDYSLHEECYARQTANLNIYTVSMNCIMDLDYGDNVSIMIMNDLVARDIYIHTLNLNIIRIGD